MGDTGMQAPDHADREGQNGNIGQDVGDGVPDEGALQIDAGAGDGRVPRLLDGRALEDADEDDGDDPRHHDGAQDVRGDAKLPGREDARVHEQDGDLDDPHGGTVDAFI